MVSPPSLSLRKFRGLNLNVDRRFIGEDQLSKALNVDFNNHGLLCSRPSPRPYAYGATNDAFAHLAADGGIQRSYFVGSLLSTGSDRYLWFASGGRFNQWAPYSDLYPWSMNTDGDFPLPMSQESSTQKIGISRGVVYVDGTTPYLYMAGGYKADNLTNVSAWTTPIAGTELYGSALLVHKDRIFISGSRTSASTKNRLYFSMEGDPDTWSSPSGGFVDVGVWDEGCITGLVSIDDRVIVFKQNSIWVLYTNGGPSNWTLRQIENFGAFERTIVENKGLIYFHNQSGVYATDGNAMELISDDIQLLFDSRNFVSQSVSSSATTFFRSVVTAAAIFDDKYLLLTLDKLDNKRLFMYDIRLKSWVEWVLEQPFIYNLSDVFALDFESNRSNQYNYNGFHLVFQNDYGEYPLTYRMDTETYFDEFFYVRDVVAFSSTTQLIGGEVFVDSELVGMRVQFLTGALAGEYRTITANTTVLITVSPAFSGTPAFADDYCIIASSDYPIEIGTKAFDLGEPGTYKKLRKSYVTAKVDSMTVTTKADNGDVISEATVTTAGTPGNMVTAPVAGNVRAQSFSLDIEVPASSNSDFILYGINMYPIPKGEVGGTYEGSDTIG